MRDNKYTDNQIVSMICGTIEDRDLAFSYMFFNWRRKAINIIMKAGAQEADAKAAISDAFDILDKHIRKGKYNWTGKLENFFIGICKWRIYSNNRSSLRIKLTSEEFELDGIEMQDPEVLMLEEEKKNQVAKILKKMGATCRKILHLYMLGYKYKDIAATLKLGNANNARQRASACRVKFRELVIDIPFFKDFLKNQA